MACIHHHKSKTMRLCASGYELLQRLRASLVFLAPDHGWVGLHEGEGGLQEHVNHYGVSKDEFVRALGWLSAVARDANVKVRFCHSQMIRLAMS